MTGSDNAFDDVKRDGPIVYLIGKSASKKLNRRERKRIHVEVIGEGRKVEKVEDEGSERT